MAVPQLTMELPMCPCVDVNPQASAQAYRKGQALLATMAGFWAKRKQWVLDFFSLVR